MLDPILVEDLANSSLPVTCQTKERCLDGSFPDCKQLISEDGPYSEELVGRHLLAGGTANEVFNRLAFLGTFWKVIHKRLHRRQTVGI